MKNHEKSTNINFSQSAQNLLRAFFATNALSNAAKKKAVCAPDPDHFEFPALLPCLWLMSWGNNPVF